VSAALAPGFLTHLSSLETQSMAKIEFQVNNTEAGSGDGNGQAHRSEDAKLQRLGVSQQLKVRTRDLRPSL
jgi:hypothetical protein